MADAEMAAAILQARMSWPDAERCAAALEQAGWKSLRRAQAVDILRALMPSQSAAACVEDLVMAGLITARAT